LLDALYFEGNRSLLQQPAVAQEGGRYFTIPGEATFYGLSIPGGEPRGGFWSYRAKVYAAAFGGDSNPERAYFNDTLTENWNFWQLYRVWKDGPRNKNFSTALMLPGYDYNPTDFMDCYGFGTFFASWVLLRDPFADWTFTNKALPLEIAKWGDAMPGALSSYYGGAYYYEGSLKQPAHTLLNVGNIGQYYAGANDAAEWGVMSYGILFDGSGAASTVPSPGYPYQNGDKVKNENVDVFSTGANLGPDQLNPDVWYTITNVNAAAQRFRIINPATGTPFTGYGLCTKVRWR
jgi:hypothetical protein